MAQRAAGGSLQRLLLLPRLCPRPQQHPQFGGKLPFLVSSRWQSSSSSSSVAAEDESQQPSKPSGSGNGGACALPRRPAPEPPLPPYKFRLDREVSVESIDQSSDQSME